MAISEEQIAEVTKRMFDEANLGRESADQVMDRTSVEDVSPQKVDIYQQNVNERAEKLNKPVKRGSSTLTKKIAEETLEGLAKAKKRAEISSSTIRGMEAKLTLSSASSMSRRAMMPSLE